MRLLPKIQIVFFKTDIEDIQIFGVLMGDF